MAMECPECGENCIVAYTQDYRREQGEPMYQIRVYVCKNIESDDGPHAFTYRNTYMGPAERLDAARFMRQYQRQQEANGQGEIQFEDED